VKVTTLPMMFCPACAVRLSIAFHQEEYKFIVVPCECGELGKHYLEAPIPGSVELTETDELCPLYSHFQDVHERAVQLTEQRLDRIAEIIREGDPHFVDWPQPQLTMHQWQEIYRLATEDGSNDS
jgi:hypothetical protein